MRNSGTVGGNTNLPYKVVDYTGGTTDTAVVNIDKENHIIYVDTTFTPIDAYTKEESDAKYLTKVRAVLDYQKKIDNENKLPAGYIEGLADVAVTGDYDNLLNRPTKVSDLINDSNFATEGYVDDAIAGLGTVFTIKGSVEHYNNLPDTGNSVGDVYYVEDEHASFVWIEKEGTEQWQQLGSSIDLDNYVTQEDFTAALRAKQDIPAIEEDEYFIILEPIFSADILRSTLESLDPEFVEKLIGEPVDEPGVIASHQYVDNFGEVWKFEQTEDSANVILVVGNIKYTASVTIETDTDTEIGGSYVVVGAISVEHLLADLDCATEDDVYKAMGILNLDDEEIDTSDNSLVLSDTDTVDEDNHMADLDESIELDPIMH